MFLCLSWIMLMDRLGNKYYEDMGELPLRERWVEYAEPHEYDSTQIEPGW